MSLPDLSSDRPRGVLVRQPQTTIYTVLLIIAFLAMAFSSLLLLIEWADYGFQFRPPANLRASAVQVPTTLPIV